MFVVVGVGLLLVVCFVFVFKRKCVIVVNESVVCVMLSLGHVDQIYISVKGKYTNQWSETQW